MRKCPTCNIVMADPNATHCDVCATIIASVKHWTTPNLREPQATIWRELSKKCKIAEHEQEMFLAFVLLRSVFDFIARINATHPEKPFQLPSESLATLFKLVDYFELSDTERTRITFSATDREIMELTLSAHRNQERDAEEA